jgi:hypothetical protein
MPDGNVIGNISPANHPVPGGWLAAWPMAIEKLVITDSMAVSASVSLA